MAERWGSEGKKRPLYMHLVNKDNESYKMVVSGLAMTPNLHFRKSSLSTSLLELLQQEVMVA